MSDIYDLVIVGGGPGGIASAIEGSIFKVGKILLIDKGDNHSQTIRKYYKDTKRVDRNWKGQKVDLIGNIDFIDGTKESTLEYFDLLLDNDSIDTIFNCEVEKVLKNDGIFEVVTPSGNYKSENVIIAIGRMGKPNQPSYKIPRSIKAYVNFNTYDCRGHEKILVIGGGDSAVEYACQLVTQNDVTLSYRGDSFSRVGDINLEMIQKYEQEEKLKVRYSTDIDSIENQEGKIKVNYSNGFHTIYDRLIYALGGTTPVDFLLKSNIKIDENDLPVFDKNYQTSVESLYLAGDIIYKNGGSIALAMNNAYDVLKDIK